MLNVFPLEDELQLHADDHVQFVYFLASVFGVFIGDSCATNKSFSTKLSLLLGGSYSVRFNLSLCDNLKQHEMVTEFSGL